MKKNGQRINLGVLYKVDPQKLSIKLCYTSKSFDKRLEQTTTYENFTYENIIIKPDVPEQISKLPTFVDGVYYCETEEEARDFIKKQIGL